MTASDPQPLQPDGACPALGVVSLDDDADFRQYILGVLKDLGHDARTVATPEQLFEACEDRTPDVVLLDIKMGRASGEETLQELRKRWPRLCVIVVTGYPSMDSMRMTFKQEVFDYVTKPFSRADVTRVLTQAASRLNLGQKPQDRLRHELGGKVRSARAERGWTLRDLSEASGVSVSQLSSIERGTHLPSIESMLAIAGALGKRPSSWLESAGM